MMEAIAYGGRAAAGFAALGDPPQPSDCACKKVLGREWSPDTGLGSNGVVSTAAGIGYFVVGAAVIGLAAYGGWVLWRRG